MADLPDLGPLGPDDYRVVGWQSSPGDPTTPAGREDFSPEGVHRTLIAVDGTDGETHFYWKMDAVVDQGQLAWIVADLQRDGDHYGELN